MTDQQNDPDRGQDDLADEQKDEAGEREQGVLTEDSEDLSSPQLTERRDDE
ncbi:MAG TPA: hypothetical protein VGK92_07190 [Gaiellales bacterium]|jgi:hypothetical protein